MCPFALDAAKAIGAGQMGALSGLNLNEISDPTGDGKCSLVRRYLDFAGVARSLSYRKQRTLVDSSHQAKLSKHNELSHKDPRHLGLT